MVGFFGRSGNKHKDLDLLRPSSASAFSLSRKDSTGSFAPSTVSVAASIGRNPVSKKSSASSLFSLNRLAGSRTSDASSIRTESPSIADSAANSYVSPKAAQLLGLESSEPASFAKVWLRRGNNLKRHASKLSLTSSINTIDDGPEDVDKFYRNDTSSRTSRAPSPVSARRVPAISSPSNFQHITHTRPAHFRKMVLTSQNDLVTEFSALRAGQSSRGEVRGMKVDDLHFRSPSITISPVTPSPRSQQSFNVTPLGLIETNRFGYTTIYDDDDDDDSDDNHQEEEGEGEEANSLSARASSELLFDGEANGSDVKRDEPTYRAPQSHGPEASLAAPHTYSFSRPRPAPAPPSSASADKMSSPSYLDVPAPPAGPTWAFPFGTPLASVCEEPAAADEDAFPVTAQDAQSRSLSPNTLPLETPLPDSRRSSQQESLTSQARTAPLRSFSRPFSTSKSSSLGPERASSAAERRISMAESLSERRLSAMDPAPIKRNSMPIIVLDRAEAVIDTAVARVTEDSMPSSLITDEEPDDEIARSHMGDIAQAPSATSSFEGSDVTAGASKSEPSVKGGPQKKTPSNPAKMPKSILKRPQRPESPQVAAARNHLPTHKAASSVSFSRFASPSGKHQISSISKPANATTPSPVSHAKVQAELDSLQKMLAELEAEATVQVTDKPSRPHTTDFTVLGNPSKTRLDDAAEQTATDDSTDQFSDDQAKLRSHPSSSSFEDGPMGSCDDEPATPPPVSPLRPSKRARHTRDKSFSSTASITSSASGNSKSPRISTFTSRIPVATSRNRQFSASSAELSQLHAASAVHDEPRCDDMDDDEMF